MVKSSWRSAGGRSVPSVSLALVTLLAACAPQGTPQSTADTAQVSSPHLDRLFLASARVALPPSNVSPLELPDPLSSGAKHLQSYCTACHALPTPGLHGTTSWPQVLRRMWLRMDHLPPEFNVPRPTTAERYVILQYLLDHAFRVTTAELPAGQGRELFSTTCARCHDLPDPRQHSPEDWVAVVVRMARHSQDILGVTIPREEVQRMILYLENASRRGS